MFLTSYSLIVHCLNHCINILPQISFKVKDVPLDEVKSFFMTSSVTGHYTQVVWAKTNEVGCGFVSYVEKEGGNVDSVWHQMAPHAVNLPQR